MKKANYGIIAGIIFGIIDILLMLPLEFPDKTAALTGAFINRFAIGFFAVTTELPVSPWIRGLIVGVLLSLPDAIITKAYAPIIIIGALGGILISVIAYKKTK